MRWRSTSCFTTSCGGTKTLRVSPAMAAGISDRLWSVDDIVALMDAAEGEPKMRGPYKPRQSAQIQNESLPTVTLPCALTPSAAVLRPRPVALVPLVDSLGLTPEPVRKSVVVNRSYRATKSHLPNSDHGLQPKADPAPLLPSTSIRVHARGQKRRPPVSSRRYSL
jgi:hypothetical protein